MELDHNQIRIAQLEQNIASLEAGYNEIHRDMVRFKALFEDREREVARLNKVIEETVEAATRMANSLEGAWEASLDRQKCGIDHFVWGELRADLEASRISRVG